MAENLNDSGFGSPSRKETNENKEELEAGYFQIKGKMVFHISMQIPMLVQEPWKLLRHLCFFLKK